MIQVYLICDKNEKSAAEILKEMNIKDHKQQEELMRNPHKESARPPKPTPKPKKGLSGFFSAIGSNLFDSGKVKELEESFANLFKTKHKK